MENREKENDTVAFHNAVVEANRSIVKALGDIGHKELEQAFEVGAGGDVSRGIDRIAEAVFFKKLSDYGTIESEESGIMGDGESRIIIDPIDGSANALSRFPYYGTSIAKTGENGILEYAAVCNLATGELFYKFAHKPVQLMNIISGSSIEIKKISDPQIGLFEKAYAHPEIVQYLKEEGLKFRSPGAVALSLAYTLYARFFIYTGPIRIYDFAAGLGLCEGLEVRVGEDYVIVTHTNELADKLEKIVIQCSKKEKGVR